MDTSDLSEKPPLPAPTNHPEITDDPNSYQHYVADSTQQKPASDGDEEMTTKANAFSHK